ncbi:hypothetical protein D3C73_1490370 [compost metagenome]
MDGAFFLKYGVGVSPYAVQLPVINLYPVHDIAVKDAVIDMLAHSFTVPYAEYADFIVKVIDNKPVIKGSPPVVLAVKE